MTWKWIAGGLLAGLLVGCATTGVMTSGFKLEPAPAGTLTVALVGSSGSPEALKAQSEAFADFVGKSTGASTRPVVFPDYDSLADASAKGMVDVVLMPPLAFIRAQRENIKVTPLLRVVRNGHPTYRSVLFTAPKARVAKLEDIKKATNLRVVWVDPSSATGYIFPKALLIQREIDPVGVFVSQEFLGSHDAVCKAVVEGAADLGATFTDDAPGAPATIATGCERALGPQAKELQIIAATEDIPNDALVVKADFPEAQRASLVKAAEALHQTSDGKKVLQEAFLAEGFAPAADADYVPVREAIDAFRMAR